MLGCPGDSLHFLKSPADLLARVAGLSWEPRVDSGGAFADRRADREAGRQGSSGASACAASSHLTAAVPCPHPGSAGSSWGLVPGAWGRAPTLPWLPGSSVGQACWEARQRGTKAVCDSLVASESN